MARPFVPPPPRFTGDYATDAAGIAQWFTDFYRGMNGDPGDFDPNNLVDPTQATISTAQQTANEAYKLAKKVDEET